MNQNNIIEFIFNEKLERENQNFYFKYVWKKNFRELKKAIIYAIIFLTIGFLPLQNFDKSAFPYIFKYFGFLFIGYIFLLIYQYFTFKKRFQIEVDKIIKKYKQKNESHFIILNSEYIEFKNPFTTIMSVWENTSYIILDDYILISPINNLYYITHKSEITIDQFKIIIDYLQKYSNLKK